MNSKFLILAVFLLFYTRMNSQDLTYSQFNSMPLLLNPAFAGNSSCNYRFSAIGRNQWMGLTNNVRSYKSGTVAGDFNLNNVFDEKYNIWGLGFSATYDQSGKGTFTNLSLLSNIAYHLRIGKSGGSFLSFGINGGIAQRGIDPANYLFNDQIDYNGKKTNTPTSEVLVNESKWYPELGFGTLVTLNPSDVTNIYGGFSVFHLLNPDISFTNTEYKLPTRTNFHGGGNFYAKGFYFLPSFFFQYQQMANYNIGSYIGMPLSMGSDENNATIGYIGLWYKSSDAICPAFRLDVGRTTFAFSYDIHTGGVSKNLSGIGSPELSINFYGCFNRNSSRMGCPSL